MLFCFYSLSFHLSCNPVAITVVTVFIFCKGGGKKMIFVFSLCLFLFFFISSQFFFQTTIFFSFCIFVVCLQTVLTKLWGCCSHGWLALQKTIWCNKLARRKWKEFSKFSPAKKCEILVSVLGRFCCSLLRFLMIKFYFLLLHLLWIQLFLSSYSFSRRFLLGGQYLVLTDVKGRIWKKQQ